MMARHRAGVALLLVLIMLPIMMISAVAALSTARSASTASDRAVSFEQARVLIADLDPMLVEWVDRHADTPPSGGGEGEPPVDPSGLRSLYVGGPTPDEASESPTLALHVEALDLSGRLHVRHHGSFARLGLPPRLMEVCERVAPHTPPSRSTPGELPPPTLDHVLDRAASPLHESVAVYPPAIDNPERVVAAMWLTTLGAGALNLNTAPIPLLEAALQGADGALRAQAVAARRAGEVIAPAIARQLIRDRATRIERHGGGTGETSGGLVPLTDRSDAYAFLITVEAGVARHRWWLTYERRRGDGGEAWRPIERRLIAP